MPLPSSPETAAQHRATESDRVSHGQRRINLIWEFTQATIALAVTASTLYVAVPLVEAHEVTPLLLLSNAFFLVIGFYFGRTNHQRIGGVGEAFRGR